VIWEIGTRFDPDARKIADRHYNRQKPGTPQFVPPGRCLVLKAPTALWVTSWPFAEWVKHDWAGAWVCSAFRNEGAGLSSDLIRQAVAATRWHFGDPPDEGFITFVDRDKTRPKRDPGYCYLKAGWERVGKTKGGLVALQQLASSMPDPEPAGGELMRMEIAV
jgi:hypothetical protein